MDYRKILLLIYLNENKDTYLLTEMANLCMLTPKQLKAMLSEMVDENFLVVIDGVYHLTDNANRYLVDEDINTIEISDFDNSLTTIKISDEKLTFEDIYIPKGFKL